MKQHLTLLQSLYGYYVGTIEQRKSNNRKYLFCGLSLVVLTSHFIGAIFYFYQYFVFLYLWYFYWFFVAWLSKLFGKNCSAIAKFVVLSSRTDIDRIYSSDHQVKRIKSRNARITSSIVLQGILKRIPYLLSWSLFVSEKKK